MKRILLILLYTFIVFILGITVGDICVSKIIKKEYDNCKKLGYYYFVFNQWLRIRQCGYTLAGYLLEKDIHRVAIYGIAELGQRLYDELVESGITVEYIIDNNPNTVFYNYKILSMKDDLLPVDAIIVTPVLSYEEIKNELKKKANYPVISLEMLLLNSRKKKITGE